MIPITILNVFYEFLVTKIASERSTQMRDYNTDGDSNAVVIHCLETRIDH
jgi:hypothetical protein